MMRIRALVVVCLFFFFAPAMGPAFGGGGHYEMPEKAAPALPEDYTLRVRFPLFSDLFTDLPIAAIDGQPVRLGEVTAKLRAGSGEMASRDASELTRNFNQVLDRLIAEKSKGAENARVAVFSDRMIGEKRTLLVHVPIFSPFFSFAPVASVNEEPIPMGEFASELGTIHAEKEESVTADYQPDNPANLLERLVIVRLVEQEARNMGMDRLGTVKRQVEAFAEKTLLYELLDRQVEGLPLDIEKAREVYRDISLAARLEDYRLPKQQDAEALQEALEKGGDFNALIAKAVKEGTAIPGGKDDFIQFKELLSQVASTAKEMEIGEISPIFRVGNGFAVFKLLERKFIEDPEALNVAEKIVRDQQVAQISKEYFASVIDRYATFNEEAKRDFNMARLKKVEPEIRLSEALARFLDDQRVLVSVNAGGKVNTLQVNEAAEKLEKMYFHGTEIALNAREADDRIAKILEDWIFRLGGTVEARKLGIDRSPEYLFKVEDFERRTLFDHFMQKIVIPDIKLTEEEIRGHYDEHGEDYMTPAMFRLESLAFEDEEAARAALQKLRKGSDFGWVSANVRALVPSDDLPLLDFGKGVLSWTSLPEGFRKSAEGIETGESILYSGPKGYHYVVYFKKVYPAELKPYESVRSEILQIVYQERFRDSLMKYVDKLKEHYSTEIYLALNDN